MISTADLLSMALALIVFAAGSAMLPYFYRKLQSDRSQLTDSPKGREEIVLPAFIAQAPRIARWSLALGLIIGAVVLALLFKENA